MTRPGRAPGERDARAGSGTGIGVAVDHLEADEVRALVERIDTEHGRPADAEGCR
jgi:hypothetical protein